MEHGVIGGEGASEDKTPAAPSCYRSILHITTFGIAFYQSNLSSIYMYMYCIRTVQYIIFCGSMLTFISTNTVIWCLSCGIKFCINVQFSCDSYFKLSGILRCPTRLTALTSIMWREIFFIYFIQHCFICRPSDSTVSEDAGIEPMTVKTLDWQSDALTAGQTILRLLYTEKCRKKQRKTDTFHIQCLLGHFR